jgi:hypothetical protein
LELVSLRTLPTADALRRRQTEDTAVPKCAIKRRRQLHGHTASLLMFVYRTRKCVPEFVKILY